MRVEFAVRAVDGSEVDRDADHGDVGVALRC